jgi:Rrf2 family protein
MFSKACEYAIRAMVYVAYKQERNEKAGVRDTAAAIDSPEAFTGKILQQLAKAGMLQSVKGPGGGFELRKNPSEVCLADIVSIIDGVGIFNNCALGFQLCSSQNPCPMHFQYKPIRDKMTEMLFGTTLLSIVESVNDGKSLLKL